MTSNTLSLAFGPSAGMQAGTTVVWVCTIVQLFVFVLWLLYRRTQGFQVPLRQRLSMVILSLLGTGASLLGIWATIASFWFPRLIFNQNLTILVLGVTMFSFVASWLGSELPRAHALLSEQKQVNDHATKLRAQLQEAYNEQEILVQQQQEMVGELNRLYHEQAQAAITDAVTSLPNHRAIISKLDEVVSHCQRTDESCAMLFVDLDHFKHVNDTWGHRAGDAILREVGRRLCNNLRQEDFVGRYGGEEFAIVLTDVNVQRAGQIAHRLLAALNTEVCHWELEDTHAVVPIAVTGSIGVAVYQLHGKTREELIQHADQAMYQAKQAGRNRVCIADRNEDVDSETVSLALSQAAFAQEIVPALTERHASEIVGMQALTAAAAARDRGTSMHAHRLVRLALATGQKLNHSEAELHLLHLAAILHDVGKIGIPDAILNKPGPLTSEEWEVMRSHPEIGRQILEELGGIFHQLAGIVVAHHERWDGKGYPYRMAGETIPLNARILTVVDSYDAMTSLRPYREPMPLAEARAELLRCSGSQFDPCVVEAFLQVLDEQEEESTPLLPAAQMV